VSSMILSARHFLAPSQKNTHYHDCHQIIYITKGAATIEVNGSVQTAQQGDLVIFSRFEHHCVTANSDDYQRYVLHIAPNSSSGSETGYQLFSILSNRPEGFSNILDVREKSVEIEHLLRRMVDEWASAQLLRDEALDLLLQELLICIYRHFPEPFSVFSEDSMETVLRIQNRFENNYQESFSLAELAEEYGVSVSYLSHQFKRVTGNSVMGYLLSCRIAAAKKYLAETTMGISQIVEECGFSDSSNFSRTFKCITGCSPTQFRQKYN